MQKMFALGLINLCLPISLQTSVSGHTYDCKTVLRAKEKRSTMLSVWGVLDFVFQRDHTKFVNTHFNLMSLRPEIWQHFWFLTVCLFVCLSFMALWAWEMAIGWLIPLLTPKCFVSFSHFDPLTTKSSQFFTNWIWCNKLPLRTKITPSV